MTERPRRRWLRRLALGFGAFLLLLILLWALRFPLFGGLMKAAIGDALASEGIRLEVEDISGSLLADAELSGVRVIDSSGLPLLEEGSIGRVSVSFSLVGLLTGRDDWIREIEIADLEGVLDLEAPPGPERPEEPPSEGGGAILLPGRVHITGFDLLVKSGPDLVQIRGAELLAIRGNGSTYHGSFGAELARSVVEGIERRAEEMRASFDYDGSVAVVEPFRMNGEDYGRVLRADLSALADDRIVADLALPLFGGSLGVTADVDLSGEYPRGDVDIAIERLDPRPVLRFIPDVPVDLDALQGRIKGRLSGLGPIGLKTLKGSYDLTITRPSYEGRAADSLALTGTLADGTFAATGRITGPEVLFEGSAAVTGESVRIDGTAHIPEMDLARLDLGPEEGKLGGIATVRAHAEGPTELLSISAEVNVRSPRFGGRTVDRLALRASGTTDEIRVDSLEVARGGDLIRMTEGTFRPSADPLEFSGTVALDVATLGPYRGWIPVELPEGLDGRIHLEATAAGTPEAPGAKLSLRITDARFDKMAAALVAIHAEMPTTERFLVSALTVEGRGDLPHLEITGARLDLGGETLGVTVGELRVTRDAQEVASQGVIHAEFSGRGLRVTAPLAAAGIGLEIDAERNGDDEISGLIRIHDGDLATLSRVLGLPVPLAGTIAGEIRLGGTSERPDLELDLDLPALTARPQGRPEIHSGPIRLRFGYHDEEARLEELSVRGEDGWNIRVGATVPVRIDDLQAIRRAPIVAGKVEIANLPFLAGGPLPGLARADGELNLSLVIGGTVEDPSLTGDLSLRAKELRAEVTGVPPVTDLELIAHLTELSPSGGRIEIETLKAVAAGARLSVRARADHRDGVPIDPTLEVNLSEADLGRIFSAMGESAPIAGQLELNCRVAPGPVITVSLEGRELAQAGFAPATLRFSGTFEDGWFQIGTARLESSAGRIDLGGRVPIDVDLESLSFCVRGEARPEITVCPDLDLAALRLGGSGLRASGRIRGRIDYTGTVDRPDAEGEIQLTHVFFRAPGAPPVDDLNGEIRIRPESIALAGLEGRLGRGEFQIHGSATRNGLEIGNLDVSVRGRDLLVMRDRTLTLRTDLDCRLTGRAPDHLKLTGDVDIRSLRYGANVDYLSTEPSLAPLPLTEDPSLSGFELDLVVQIPPRSTKIRTNVLVGELEGRLEVGGTLAIPRPDGRIRIIDGVAVLPTTSLDVTRGFVEFRKTEPLRPYLDAGLATTIAGTELTVGVNGPASNLRIELSSNPPLPEPDILSILVTGVPRSELGAGTVGSVAATILYRQLTSSLGGDDSGESSGLADIARSFQIEVDTSSTSSGGTPNWSATLPLIGDWFLLRGGQDEPENYGLDLIWRLSFK